MAITLDGTKGMTNASWTTAGRPASPSNGQFGLNTTLNQISVLKFKGSLWMSRSHLA